MFRVIEILLFFVGVLLGVAYLTVAERKTMGYMQRRLGPNEVGFYGLLQAFADAAKLLLKEIIIPVDSDFRILVLAPVVSLVTALLGWLLMPLNSWSVIGDLNLSVVVALAISSVGVFGVLLAGWSANNKYALMGSIRSSAQLISYELVLTSLIIIVVLLTGSLSFFDIIQSQRFIWFAIPFSFLFILFFIASVAETNRPPFDLPEAESELVAGFMTEHSASPFVFFFLAEYSNIFLICTEATVFFLGSYFVLPFISFGNLFTYLPLFNHLSISWNEFIPYLFYYFSFDILPSYLIIISYSLQGFLAGIILAIKVSSLLFTFIWVRASFPRFRFDNLITLCWTILLPLVFSFLIIIPILLFIFDSLPFHL